MSDRPLNSRQKVFDWVAFFGMMALVVFAGSSLSWAQDKPESKKRGAKAKVVAEREQAGDSGEADDDFIITIRLPKPEAMIFSNPLKTRYSTLDYKTSFLDEIMESAKHSPF